MNAYVPAYDARAPRTLKEALVLLAEGGWTPLAGGTDLMVLFEAGKLPRGRYLSLWGLKELTGIALTKSHATLGALTTYTMVRRHGKLQKLFPMLTAAARETGAPAIQNRGTLGGNIANASPAADTPPVLLAYGAEVQLVCSQGSRWIPYTQFHLDYKKTALSAGELVARIRMPVPPAGSVHYYRKVGTREAQAIAKVSFAGLRTGNGRLESVRISLGSVCPVPFRGVRTEAFLAGKELTSGLVKEARELLAAEIAPIDDIRSTRSYRTRVACNLLEAFLELR